MTSPVLVHECPHCNGSGWRSADSPRERRVTRCECTLRDRAGRLLAQARVPVRYEHCELPSFHAEYAGSNASLSNAALIAGRFVEEYPLDKDKTGLLFLGPIGVGKTHLAVGILRELILSKGIHGLFYDYRELLKEIQNSYNPTVAATEMSILRPVFEAELLVLDELGAVKPTEWVWDTVSLILNTRYNNNRTTIITSNFPNLPAREARGNLSSRSREAADDAARGETLGDRIGERMRSR